VAWNIVVTFPIVFFFFKETKQVSLEDIDLLFGERALGTLPDDLHKETGVEHTEGVHGDANEIGPSPVVAETEGGSEKPMVESPKAEKPRVEGEAV